MKKILAILVVGVIGWQLFALFSTTPFGENKMQVGKEYLDTTVPKTGVVNTVTSIIVNYRGFDTLGEVTVLFLAATGLGAILYGIRGNNAKREDEEQVPRPASVIVEAGAKALFPLIILMGAYIFIHGHLTPGGGFQGGTIIATGVLFLFLGVRTFHANHTVLSVMESLAGLTFVSVGILGLINGGTFLENILPTGVPNTLLSGGVIPIIYIAVGFKVGAELSGVLDAMLQTTKDKS